MLFILFVACVGHIGAVPQGTEVPSLKQLATIAAAKKLVQEIHSEKPKNIKKYITDKTKLPADLHNPLLAEIGRQYYMSYGEKLETGVPWGFSIQDYLTIPALKEKMPEITTNDFGQKVLNLSNMKINDLKGLQNIPNIKTVQTLFLDNNQLTTIQPNAFAGLTNLEWLGLGENQLSTIPTKAFAGLTNLKDLFLRDNQLTTIQPNAFTGLTSLTELYLGYNQLTTIPTKAFAGLTNLEKLFISNNRLTTISPNAFAGLTNLRGLVLSRNQLKDIPTKAFASLTNLGNNGHFGFRTGLRWLRLDNNQLNKKTKEAIKEALPRVTISF